jgi:hypothetical protein
VFVNKDCNFDMCYTVHFRKLFIDTLTDTIHPAHTDKDRTCDFNLSHTHILTLAFTAYARTKEYMFM